MHTLVLVLGSILIVIAGGLFWRVNRILKKLAKNELLDLSLTAMIEELEQVAQQNLAAIRDERLKLQELLTTHRSTTEQPTLSPDDKEENEDRAFDKHRTICHLADTGLKTHEIARQLGVGKGEVELILGLKQYHNGADKKPSGSNATA